MWLKSDFADDIAWAIKELKLTGVKITWEFRDSYFIPGEAFGDVKTNVHAKTAKIRVAASKTHCREFVLNTIWHELRHVWQDIKGVMKETWHHGEELDKPVYSWTAQGKQRIRYYGNSYWVHEWKGTEFAEAVTWSRKQYTERPNEVDARMWALEASNRRYGTKHQIDYVRKRVGKIGGTTIYKIPAAKKKP